MAEFKRRWPTAPSDDQVRIDEAWFALSLAEGQAALAGITAFLEGLKAAKRSTVPAGWTYLRQKRWTLLPTPKAAPSGAVDVPARPPGNYERGTVEAKAISALYAIARASPFILRGMLVYPREVTPQLRTFAEAGERDKWIWIEDRQQIAAWNAFLAAHVLGPRSELTRVRGAGRGFFAPWPWPPRKDGTISNAGEAA